METDNGYILIKNKTFFWKNTLVAGFVYNKLLQIKQILYKKFKISLSEFDLNNHLTFLKDLYPWLKKVNSQSLQQASKNLNSTFTNFFKNGSVFLKKKSKKNTVQSFQIPQHYRIGRVPKSLVVNLYPTGVI